MKIQELITKEIKTGKTVKASSWRAVQIDKTHRQIWHYSTMMAELTNDEFCQVSNGHGSVSDKRGLHKLRQGVTQKGYLELPFSSRN